MYGSTVRFILTSDGEATKAPFLFESLSLANSGVFGDEDWVVDEAILVSLHLADHFSLIFWRAVVVNDTNTALKSHVDGHFVLGHGVHGRGHKGGLERDALGNGRIKGDIGGGEANVAGKEEKVIVGQTAVDLGVHQIMDAESITGFVLLEDLLSFGEVLNYGRAVGGTVGGRHFVFSVRGKKGPSHRMCRLYMSSGGGSIVKKSWTTAVSSS